jgi:hypothetical protein
MNTLWPLAGNGQMDTVYVYMYGARTGTGTGTGTGTRAAHIVEWGKKQWAIRMAGALGQCKWITQHMATAEMYVVWPLND